MLIAIEGIDCAGKTTLVNYLQKKTKCIVCKELSSPLGSIIRHQILPQGSFFLKTFFFACDRAWIYEKEAKPALDDDKIVVWDRYVDSALAYRKAEEDSANIITYSFVEEINKIFPEPDHIFYVKIPLEVFKKRSITRGEEEPYDSSFLSRVSEFYDKKYLSSHSCTVIDGTLPVEVLCDFIEKEVKKLCDY